MTDTNTNDISGLDKLDLAEWQDKKEFQEERGVFIMYLDEIIRRRMESVFEYAKSGKQVSNSYLIETAVYWRLRDDLGRKRHWVHSICNEPVKE